MRYQWLQPTWRLNYNELCKSLLSNSYDDKTGIGFIIDETYRERKISGRYVQRVVNQVKIQNPYGDTESYQQITYQNYGFSIDMDCPYGFLLLNPLRSSVPLMSAIGKATNYKVGTQLIRVDLIQWLECLKQEFSSISINRIDVVNLPLDKGIIGSVSLKGNVDVFKGLEKIPNYEMAKISKIELSFINKDGCGKAIITHQSSVRMMDEQSTYFLLPVLNKTLNKIAK